MSINWLNSINWPEVIAGTILGGIICYFITRWQQRRPKQAEFNATIPTTLKSETDTSSKSMQFKVGLKGDIQNVNIEIKEEKIVEEIVKEEEKEEET